MPDPEVEGDPPIITSGGSVKLEFDTSSLPPDTNGNFYNADKVIKRVEITGEGIENYDQEATGTDIVVKIFYGDE